MATEKKTFGGVAPGESRRRSAGFPESFLLRWVIRVGVSDPTYQNACTDRHGHAEVVEVTYDPSKFSYADLLKVLWEIHDSRAQPAGTYVGTQYRTVIFSGRPKGSRCPSVEGELERSGATEGPWSRRSSRLPSSGALRNITSSISKNAAW